MAIDRFANVARLWFRSLFRRAQVERELDDEFRDHVDRQAEENIRRGMSPRAARQAALRAFGGLELQKERSRDARGTRWLEEILVDLRFALRGIRRAPGFCLTIILTLALGIGANTAMFTLLRGTLLRPLPNRDGDRLIYMRQTAPAGERGNLMFSVPEIADYRASAKTLSAIAEYSDVMPFTLVGDDGIPARVKLGIISGNYFDVVGLEPVLGRVTTPRDDGPSAASVAVLSYDYWIDHFGGDRHVIGRAIRLNDKLSTIVGVLQPSPAYPEHTDLYANIVTSPHHLGATMQTNRSHRMSEVFARLAPGETVEQARDEIARISSNMFKDHPDAYEKASKYTITVMSLHDAMAEHAVLMFWLLMGAAVFVLLIACANVANLTLMRGIGREREMQMRAALGAARSRLRRLLLVENLTLALIGGALGVLVALAGLRMLVAFAAQFSPRASEIRIDGVVLAVGLLTSIVAATVLAFVPRIGPRHSLAESLAPAGRQATLGRGRQRVQRALVVAQIALSMVLLAGAGLLVRTLAKLQSIDSGIHATQLLSLDVPLGGDLLKQIMDQPGNLARYERIRDRVAALPGVEMASVAGGAPLRYAMMDMQLLAEGRVVPSNLPTPHASMRMVDPRYFTATGIPLVSGRQFTSADRRGSPRVVILSASFAKQLFGNENPLGRRVAFTGAMLKLSPFTQDWLTVVGVVGDTRDGGVEHDVTPTVYESFAQEIIIGATLLVRTSADPATLQPEILRAVHGTMAGQLVERVATIEQIRDESVAPRRLNALVISAFGVLALVIATIGIAGVLGFSVRSRTAEIAIRMSLGANAGRVYRMVLSEGGLLLCVGLAIGVVGALFTARFLRGLLFGVTPHDPVTLVAVAIVLGAIGVAASWLPAARAAHVDPAAVLRAE